MTCAEAGKLGASKQREPILARARQLCAELGQPIPAALNPPLMLTLSDKVR
jgi:hypothetical protein